jgi:hypothetical protein
MDGAKRSNLEIDRAALYLVTSVQGLLVLAKSGLTDADIKMARAAILAITTQGVACSRCTAACPNITVAVSL